MSDQIVLPGSGQTVDAELLRDGVTHIERAKIVLGNRNDDAGDLSAANPMPSRDEGASDLLGQLLDAIGRGIEVLVTGASNALPVAPILADTFASVSFSRPNDAVTLATAGQSGCAFSLPRTGTLVGVLTPEWSVDGATWATANLFFDPSTNLTAATITITSVNVDTVRQVLVPPGAGYVRVRVSTYTSGRAVVAMRAGFASPVSIFAQGPIAPAAALASAGNPVRVAGDDGTNLRGLRTDTTGRPMSVGAAAAGVAAAGNPVQCGGVDIFGTTQSLVANKASDGTKSTGGLCVFSANQSQNVAFGAVIAANGSGSAAVLYGTQVSLMVAVTGSPTGSTPTLQYELREISSVDGATIMRTVKGPVMTAATAAHQLTLSGIREGLYQVAWTVGGSSPSFSGVSAQLQFYQTTDVTPQYRKELAYGATVRGFTIAAAATGTKSLIYLLQTSLTSLTRVNVHRITMTAAGGTGTGSASITFVINRVSAVGSGGSAVTPVKSCQDDAAAVVTCRTGDTSAPTPVANSERFAEEVPLNYGRAVFDAVAHGGPLEMCPGVVEGWQVSAVINGTIATDVHVTVTMDWTEHKG